MPCYVPFGKKNLDVSFFVLKPVGGFSDELVTNMKYFSFHAEDLGCISSSLFKSVHGNMIIWYGAWMRRPSEQKEMLHDALVSGLSRISHLAVLEHHNFFQVFYGESEDGYPAAKFITGDTILLNAAMASVPGDMTRLPYACLALLRSSFPKEEKGVSSSVCMQSSNGSIVVTLQVWKTLQACYSWLLASDYRNTVRPYITGLADDAQFDVFKVVYVSNDEVLDRG